MIEEITSRDELKKIQYGEDWLQDEFKNCFVDLSQKVERPETLISIGEHQFGQHVYPTPVMTAGEFSVIAGMSKSKKSFLKSFFAAAYIGGNSNRYFTNIKGHRNHDDIIIDCDTEQSKYYSQFTFQRVFRIVGGKYENYIPFKMRHLNPEQRVAFIDGILNKREYKGKVKLVFIDGIADLIEDSNDLVMSNYIAGKLLEWTDKMNIHVNVIIHNAYGTPKPTGHLGSAVVKKAETVISLTPEDDEKRVIKVESLYSRGISFEPFWFRINKDSLPEECTETGNVEDFTVYEPSKNGKKEFKPF